jgi:hypothetical protein
MTMTTDEIKALVNTALKEALPAGLKAALGEGLADAVKVQVKAALDEAVKPINDRLTDLDGKVKAAPAAELGKGKGGELDPGLKALHDEVEALKTARKAADDRATQAEQGRQRQALETSAREALLKAGVPAARVPLALHTLFAEGKLTTDAKGAPIFKGRNDLNLDADLDVGKGIEGWLDTEVGKEVLPPRGVNGAGGGGGEQVRVGAAPRAAGGALDWSGMGKALIG